MTLRQWTDVVKRARLGRTVTLVALTLATYADSDGTRVFPGNARLAVDCELTYNVVQAAMATLRRAGLIELVKRAGRRGTANEYRLTLHPDLLERVEVLSPAAVVAAAAHIRQARSVLESRRTTTRPVGGQPADDNPGHGLSPADTTTHAVGGNPGTTTHGVGGPQPTPCVPTSQYHVTTTTSQPPTDSRTEDADPRAREEPLWTDTPPAAATTATTPTAPNPTAPRPGGAPPAAATPSDAPTPRRRRNTRQRPTQPAKPARTSKTRTRSEPAPAATPPPPAQTTPAAGDPPTVWVAQEYGPPKAARIISEHPDRRHIVKIIYLDSHTAAWINRNRIHQEQEHAA